MQVPNTTVRKRLPPWLKRPVIHSGHYNQVVSCLEQTKLHTVCVEAKCPNRGECYSSGCATFLILGNVCSRNCRFCSVGHGSPPPPDPDEPGRIAEAARRMGLKHIVVTSVTRDDLQDGGAAHFASVITAVRSSLPGASIEVLVPDFNGDPGSLDIVMNACPDIFNHNIETVPRLYSRIRPGADYARSIRLLHEARLRLAGGKIKSGLMVGFGEREEEVLEVMKDCLGAGCSILTIGQYLQPSGNQVPVEEFITPGQFKKYELKGLALGFEYVFSGPYIRSSYRASECAKTLNRNVIKR